MVQLLLGRRTDEAAIRSALLCAARLAEEGPRVIKPNQAMKVAEQVQDSSEAPKKNRQKQCFHWDARLASIAARQDEPNNLLKTCHL